MTPPREVFAAAVRKAIEDHDEWDSPHQFQTLHWDGEKLTCGTYACIMPDIAPADYPALMAGMAAKRQEEHPEDPAYAYLLQIEGFSVIGPAPDASEEEWEQFNRDRHGRTFHQRPDAVESALAYCADVHGRLWYATKARCVPGVIDEGFRPPNRPLGGQMIQGLLAVAYATGTLAYGLPGPPGPLN